MSNELLNTHKQGKILAEVEVILTMHVKSTCLNILRQEDLLSDLRRIATEINELRRQFDGPSPRKVILKLVE